MLDIYVVVCYGICIKYRVRYNENVEVMKFMKLYKYFQQIAQKINYFKTNFLYKEDCYEKI